MFAFLSEYPDPPESGVQIWTAELDSVFPDQFLELNSLLDPAESARAARFHFEHDRRHYIISRGLLRRLVGAALGLSASAVAFEYGARGKPEIAAAGNERTLRFNLAHSAGWAMFALAWDRPLGIDLEAGTRLGPEDKEMAALAARVLSARELAIWRALPDAAARRVAFLRAWTRKEAYGKAKGEGVFEQLEAIEVALDAAAPATSLKIFSPGELGGQGWTVYDLAAPRGFAAALAIEDEPEKSAERSGLLV